MTSDTGYTAADVAALADLVRPRVEAGFSVREAVALAVADAERDAELARHGCGARLAALVAAFAGTYDEFRAEAGLAEGQYAYRRTAVTGS